MATVQYCTTHTYSHTHILFSTVGHPKKKIPNMNCNCHRTGTDSMNGVGEGKWATVAGLDVPGLRDSRGINYSVSGAIKRRLGHGGKNN